MFQQFLTAFTASLAHTIMAGVNTWPSYTQDILTANDTMVLTRPLNDLEVSLLGSIPSLGAMLGTVVVGSVIDTFGRRKGGLLINIISLLSWVLIELSSSSSLVLGARFLAGIPSGASLVFGPMIISETAQESIRGMLASGPLVFYCLGALSSYLMGWFLTYHTIIRLNLLICILAAAMSMVIVESPVFLMRQKKEKEARKAVAKYRGLSQKSKIVHEETTRLKQQLISPQELTLIKSDEINDEKNAQKEKNEEERLDIEDVADTKRKSPIKVLFTSPTYRRAFFVVFFTGTCQGLMGMMSVQVYAKEIFKHSAPDVSPNFFSVLFALVLLAGGLVTAGIADKAGRRFLVILSSTLVGICLIIMAVLMQTSIAPSWVTAVMVLVYSFTYFCGAGSVPFILLAEVFTNEIQGVASMIFVEWIWFLNFILIGLYPPLLKNLGLSGVFYIYASVAFLNAVGSYYIVPETKGLSYKEIQEKFAKGSR